MPNSTELQSTIPVGGKIALVSCLTAPCLFVRQCFLCPTEFLWACLTPFWGKKIKSSISYFWEIVSSFSILFILAEVKTAWFSFFHWNSGFLSISLKTGDGIWFGLCCKMATLPVWGQYSTKEKLMTWEILSYLEMWFCFIWKYSVWKKACCPKVSFWPFKGKSTKSIKKRKKVWYRHFLSLTFSVLTFLWRVFVCVCLVFSPFVGRNLTAHGFHL